MPRKSRTSYPPRPKKLPFQVRCFTLCRRMKLVHFLALSLLSLSTFASSPNWPQFRGPDASGLSDQAAPTRWDLETGKNVRWQKSIPGLGHACPIIWQDRVYIATAVKPSGRPDLKIGIYGDGASYQEKEPHQWRLLCLDKKSGKWLWENLGWKPSRASSAILKPPTATQLRLPTANASLPPSAPKVCSAST